MIKFIASNLVATSNLTASTENSQYPSSNIKHPFRTKVWRSTSSSDNLIIDFGSAEPVDTICIAPDWQNSWGVSTITIEANATADFTSPAFTTTMVLDQKFDISVKEITEQEYRFWRVVCTSTLEYCELSTIVLGKRTEISTNGFGYGYQFLENDLRTVSRSRYGQEFIDDITTQKQLSGMSITIASLDEVDQFYEVYDLVRSIHPFFLYFGDSGVILNDENRLSGYYKFTNRPDLRHRTAGFWDISMSFREQK